MAVLPTFYDPSSRFILEAIAAGKPVITTRYNGASELLTDYRHGRIIDEPENIEALADGIVYFTNKDNIANASEAIAADSLKERISIDSAVRRLIRLYETILEKEKEVRMDFLLLIIAAYFVGSIPFAYIFAKIKGIDIRNIGSGNIGATNLSRALGKKWGYFCFILDTLKGLLPTLAASWILPANPSAAQLFGALAVAAAAGIGPYFSGLAEI